MACGVVSRRGRPRPGCSHTELSPTCATKRVRPVSCWRPSTTTSRAQAMPCQEGSSRGFSRTVRLARSSAPRSPSRGSAAYCGRKLATVVTARVDAICPAASPPTPSATASRPSTTTKASSLGPPRLPRLVRPAAASRSGADVETSGSFATSCSPPGADGGPGGGIGAVGGSVQPPPVGVPRLSRGVSGPPSRGLAAPGRSSEYLPACVPAELPAPAPGEEPSVSCPAVPADGSPSCVGPPAAN